MQYLTSFTIEYIFYDDYIKQKLEADILLLTMMYTSLGEYSIEELQYFKDFSSMIFILPLTLVGYYESDTVGSCGWGLKEYKKFGMNYCFWDSLIYNSLKKRRYNLNGCMLMGNPKFDAIYDKISRSNQLCTKEGWEKLENKTIFLWAFDHEWETNNFTFDQYAKLVFQYFDNHPNLGLIFRPHPSCLLEFKYHGIWTEKDITLLREYITNTSNIIWDENSDYSYAYSMANVIITDVQCGITVSALATKKPLCVFFRMGVPKHIEFPELIDNLYQVQSEQECIEFFEMIQRGEDPMKEQREQAFHNCICHFDGKNGQRMKDFIAEKYFEKYGTPENQE